MAKKRVQDQYEFASRLALAVYVIAILAAGFYFIRFWGRGLSSDPERWGQFGDYLGGVINPIVGVVTVLLIVVNIRMQRDELRASLAELKRSNENSKLQSFEQSLFAWLSNYHSLIDSVKTSQAAGRHALTDAYERFLRPGLIVKMGAKGALGMREVYPDHEAQQLMIRLFVPGPKGIDQLSARLKYAAIQYQKLYQEYRSDLDAPLRTLYRLLKWINESSLSADQKWHYAALVRAQLSWIELVFLFYNGLSERGAKFALLANDLALFDNLDTTGDFTLFFAVTQFTPMPDADRPKVLITHKWPYTPSAFSSDLARKRDLSKPLSVEPHAG